MLFLLLVAFFCEPAFSMEESPDGGDLKRAVSSYASLTPDSLDKVYNPMKEAHRLAVSQRSDMPLCLQTQEGPFPFYGHPLDMELTALMTQYFASLKFDEGETRTTTTTMRKEAEAIQERETERAIELLYDAGWKMGDPLAIQSLIHLLEEKSEYSKGLLPKRSNLLSILKVYPRTEEKLIEEIVISRQGLDYQQMGETSEELGFSESEGSFDEGGEKLGLLESYGVRHRQGLKPQ